MFLLSHCSRSISGEVMKDTDYWIATVNKNSLISSQCPFKKLFFLHLGRHIKHTCCTKQATAKFKGYTLQSLCIDSATSLHAFRIILPQKCKADQTAFYTLRYSLQYKAPPHQGQGQEPVIPPLHTQSCGGRIIQLRKSIHEYTEQNWINATLKDFFSFLEDTRKLKG